mgnify:CR=1 FL=1
MSNENLERFMNQVAESEELQAKIGEEIDSDALIALGVEQGFEFTVEDLQENAELSDEELDGVAGGISAGDTDVAASPTITVNGTVRGRRVLLINGCNPREGGHLQGGGGVEPGR